MSDNWNRPRNVRFGADHGDPHVGVFLDGARLMVREPERTRACAAESSRREAHLPPPLMTSDPGSFAQHTVVERMPQIVQRVIADSDFPAGIVQALDSFKDEIASQPIRPLVEQALDVAGWNRELAAHRGATWLGVGWYFAETYFYRRLLEAVRYFQPGPWFGCDPFEKQKQEQEQEAVSRLADVWSQLDEVDSEMAFEAILHSCLWGNRADLSHASAIVPAPAGLTAREEQRHIIVDHTRDVREILAVGLQRVDFANDNVGLDLLFDLVLTDFMFAQGWVEKVVFHLKDRPFFVSDAMPKDVRATLALLDAASDAGVRGLGERLSDNLATGRLALTNDSTIAGHFWASSLMFRRLPPPLRVNLARSNLTILKGDVNYRRLLDDRRWSYTTPLEIAAGYFPAPLLALRTLKGEIMVGLEAGQAQALAADDPNWLTNGRRGVVQLVCPPVDN